ncbi:hypothetical protein HV198_09005 [Citrobacter freundii]|uniref:DUF7296 family protein n=1 Tax=Citrobacter freundii TaxID=546 RepID=UPI0015E4E291|nr:hypothetical protein [Citrobacter freundii]QLO42278.1 hypothetical protein HV215_09005 [Citrobacter freundii]QLV40442.1 hypothetical protein HV198_09005 [Citrobacter freundii]
MQTSDIAGLRWWHFNQNNSGGYFIDNNTVSHDVFIQARNADEARTKAENIFEPYSEYCTCCGERWCIDPRDDEGSLYPEIYGTPVHQVEKGIFRKSCVLHYHDGLVEKLQYK